MYRLSLIPMAELVGEAVTMVFWSRLAKPALSPCCSLIEMFLVMLFLSVELTDD